MKRITTFILSALVTTIAAAGPPAPRMTVISPPSVLLVIGPVESIDRVHGKAVVLGQTVSIDQNAQISPYLITGMYGLVEPNSTLNLSSVQSKVAYIPGFTPVLLTGVVTKSDARLGRITIGTVVVDLTNTFAGDNSVVPPEGALVQLVGTQPVERGIILAEAIRVGSAQIENGGVLATLNLSQWGLNGSGITGSGDPAPPVVVP